MEISYSVGANSIGKSVNYMQSSVRKAQQNNKQTQKKHSNKNQQHTQNNRPQTQSVIQTKPNRIKTNRILQELSEHHTIANTANSLFLGIF